MCDVKMPKVQTIARFLEGLKLEIEQVMQLQPYWMLNDEIWWATKIYKQQLRTSNLYFSRYKTTVSNQRSSMSKMSASSKANTSQLFQKKDKGIVNNPSHSNTVFSNFCNYFKC